MTSNKIKSFIKEFVAVVKGDNAEALAQKAFRQADAALESEIAVQKGKLVDAQTEVENSEENLTLARVNGGNPISSREGYILALKNAKNANTNAVSKKEGIEEFINFLEDERKKLNVEVDA